MELIDRRPFEKEQFISDMRETAQALGAGFKEDTLHAALEAFGPEFHQCPVQLKATSRPGDGLYYRILDSERIDRTAHARAAGLIGFNNHPLLTLQGELLATCPGSFSAGVDFDAGFGLAKAWSFTAGTPIESLCQRVPSLPASVRAHVDLLRRFGMGMTTFVASDFQRRTTNVYFDWDMELRSEEWLQSFARATGTEVPSSSLCYDILATQLNTGCIAVTFSWDSQELNRWTTYAPDVPYEEPESGVHLPSLGPRLEVLRHAPTLNARPQYNLSWAFAETGWYLKLERGYARDVSHFMRSKMGLDIFRDKTLSIVLPRRKVAG
jgi:hypothetical protein